MQNVEFKAELRDPALAEALCRNMGAALAATLTQTDTYYRLADGRLKKRAAIDHGQGALPDEYIFYHRENDARPRLSRFTIYTASEALERFGRVDPGPPWVVVSKTRHVWMHEHVRIHLDSVDGLGAFIEFEAMVSSRHPVDACHAAVAHLRARFAPVLGEPISLSYSDMVATV